MEAGSSPGPAGPAGEDSVPGGTTPPGPSHEMRPGGETPESVPPEGEVLSTLQWALGEAPSVRLREAAEDALLDVPAGGASASGAPAPARLGRYSILHEIARGGIGVVYRVNDIELGRDLALKVLLPEHRGREEAIQRFVEEAQIGGQLQHPGIVPVHEIGVLPGELPYFTMKLIKGQTFAAILEGRERPTDGRQQFLAVFEQVAQTLAYAHSRGVIHRDLKPSNIMVGAFGEVQVMDWGLARVLAEGGVHDERKARRTHAQVQMSIIRTVRSEDESSQTLSGSVLGTPAYMPPEQARGDVEHLDERSDVFSLGAILCEVLTGHPPYVGKTSREILRKAEEGALDDAFARLGDCHGDPEVVDLARICLSPEPRERPRDASSVAKVMRRYFDTIEEKARRAEIEAGEAAARAAGERRARSLTTAAIGLVLLSLLAGGVGYVALERMRQDRATAATQAVERSLAEAGALRAEAAGAEPADLARWDRAREAAERAVDLARGPDVAEAARLEAGAMLEAAEGGKKATRAAAERRDRDARLIARLDALRLRQVHAAKADLSKLAPLYEQTFREQGFDPGADAVEGSASKLRGSAEAPRIARGLDAWAAADPLRREKLLQLALAIDPDPTRSRIRLAVQAGDHVDLERIEGELLPDRPDPLAEQEIRRSRPATPSIPEPPALTVEHLVTALIEVGASGRALEVSRKAYVIHPGDFWLQHHLGYLFASVEPDLPRSHRHFLAAASLRRESSHAWQDLAAVLERRGDLDGSVIAHEKAAALEDREPAADGLFAAVLAKTGALDAAEAVSRRAVDRAPGDPGLRLQLAEVLLRKGDGNGAVEAVTKALEMDPLDPRVHRALARSLEERGSLRQAAGAYEKAAGLDPSGGEDLYHEGRLLLEVGDLLNADPVLQKAIKADPELAPAHQTLALVMARKGYLDSAARSLARAIELAPLEETLAPHGRRRASLPPESAASGPRARIRERSDAAALAISREVAGKKPDDAGALTLLAVFQLRLGNDEAAVASLRRTLEIDPESRQAMEALAVALLRRSSASEDGAALDEAIHLLGKARDAPSPSAAVQNNLGVALHRKGRRVEALQAIRKALQIDSKRAKVHFNLGQALLLEKRPGEALGAFTRATTLDSEDPETLLALGETHVELMDQRQSKQWFYKTLELSPGNVRALRGLGRAFSAEVRFEKAIAFAREALKTDPLDARSHELLGDLLDQRGDFEGSAQAYRQALRLDERSADAANKLGDLHALSRDEAQAIEAWRQAIEIDPMTYWPYRKLIDRLEDEKLEATGPAAPIDDLVVTLDRILSSGVEHHALAREAFLLAWARRPGAAVSSRPLELAREDVEQSLRRSPRAWRLLARVLAASGAMEEAISAMEEACTLSPDRKDLGRELAALRARAAPDLPTYGTIDAALEEAEPLLARGSVWRYSAGAEAPPGLQWTEKSFDDRMWKEGKAPFGFGASFEDELEGKEGGTTLEGMLGRHTSLHTRAAFTVAEPGRFRRIVLRVHAHDGAVAHVNGREAGRVNAGAPGQPLDHEAAAVERKHVPETFEVELSRGLIEPGANVLAIQGLAFARDGGTFLLEATIVGEPGEGALEERLAAFRRLASGDDAPARLAFFEGRLHERAGRHEQAVESFRRVLALDRSREEPFLHLLESLKMSRGAAAAYALVREETARGFPRGLAERLPDTPGTVRPPPGETLSAPGVVLETTPFFSFGGKETHVRTQWEVRAEGADYDRDPAVRFLSESSLDRLEIPPGILLPRTTYRWRAAYIARGSATQVFGTEASFSTGDFPFRAVPFDLLGLFNRDVIVGAGEKLTDFFDSGAYALMGAGFDGEGVNDVVLRPLPADRRVGVHVVGESSKPNALQVSSGDTSPIRLAAPPGRYALVRFLLGGGNGWSRLPVTLEYADGTRDEAQLTCLDWGRGIGPLQPHAWEVTPIRGSMHRVDASRNALAEAQAQTALFEQAIRCRADRDLAAIVLRPDAAVYESRKATVFNLLAVTGIILHAEK